MGEYFGSETDGKTAGTLRQDARAQQGDDARVLGVGGTNRTREQRRPVRGE